MAVMSLLLLAATLVTGFSAETPLAAPALGLYFPVLAMIYLKHDHIHAGLTSNCPLLPTIKKT